MGFTPREVDEMSLWQFTACCEGWRAANAPDEGSGRLSDDDFDALSAMVDAHSVVRH